LLASTQEIENLLQDKNKSIVCLAISLLLKVCNKTQIENLLKKVQENIGIVSDDFKIEILKSIKQLIKKNPSHYRPIINYLSEALKEEGS